MTLKEIKDAVLAGKEVCWGSPSYRVVHDTLGQWFIRFVPSGHCIGLTHRDGVTLNGREEEFSTWKKKPDEPTGIPTVH